MICICVGAWRFKTPSMGQRRTNHVQTPTTKHPTNPQKTNPTTGSSNAYTDTEDTVYYFDVDSHFLEGALDRFAWFFKAPLFTAR